MQLPLQALTFGSKAAVPAVPLPADLADVVVPIQVRTHIGSFHHLRDASGDFLFDNPPWRIWRFCHCSSSQLRAATEDDASVFSTQKVKCRRPSCKFLMDQQCATSGRAQVDIQDKENEIVVYADTPGMTNADVRVRFSCWRLFPS